MQFGKFAIAAVLLAWSATAASAASEIEQVAQDFLKSFNAKYGFSNSVMGVTKDGKLVALVSEGGNPTRAVPLGSNGKTVTAAAVLKLAGEQKINLDATLGEVLPKLVTADVKDKRILAIKVRHLASHSSGFARIGPNDPIGPSAINWLGQSYGGWPNVTSEHVAKIGLGAPLEFDPGTGYAYSNLNYLMLGLVIEAASGSRYVNYVHNDVLKPVGIDMERPEPRFVALYPFANMRMTPAQFLKWMQVFEPSQSSAITQLDLTEVMYKPHGVYMDAEKTAYYNFAWNIRPRQQDTYLLWHTGSTQDSNSLAIRSDFGASWFIAMNRQISVDARRELETESYARIQAVKEWPSHDLFPQQKL